MLINLSKDTNFIFRVEKSKEIVDKMRKMLYNIRRLVIANRIDQVFIGEGLR